jgi:CheY-like chemotaxis protein
MWGRELVSSCGFRWEVNEMKETKLRILIVDDEEMVGKMLKTFFEIHGAQVGVAQRGDEALALLRKEQFDAAVVDMRLPDITGDELIIKAAGISPDVHFFIHTGSMDFRLSERLRDIGMQDSDIIQKPVRDMNEIFAAIQSKMQKKA